MVLSASLSTLVLTILASRWPYTIQTYPETLQMLDTVSPGNLANNDGQGKGPAYDLEENPEGEPEVLSDLWSDISSAFQFLEDRPMDQKLKAKLLAEEIELIRMREKAKRLPFTQHNFVRFGKRSLPNFDAEGKREHHSFVRFGKRHASPETLAGSLTGDNSDSWKYNGDGRRHHISQSLLNLGLNGDDLQNNLEKRRHSFVRFGRSLQTGDANAEKFQQRLLNSFDYRVRRSTSSQDENDSLPADKSNTLSRPGVDDTLKQNSKSADQPSTQKTTDSVVSALPSLRAYVKRRLSTARIGRLPAAVFYPQGTEIPSGAPETSGQHESFLTRNPAFNLNILPRYG